MALNDINIPNAASDVVGVFDQNFNQVFPTARPMKAQINESARAMEHPVETGTVITDHIIFEPNEIELSMVLPRGDYRSVYQQIEQIYKAAQVLSVQTRAATYNNMFIYRMPHIEDTEVYDALVIIVRFRQILIVQTTTQTLPAAAVKNPTDQSTINNGLQQPGPSKSLPPPADFSKIYQGLPPSGVVNPNAPGFQLKLPPGVQPPPPNAQSYINYEGKDLPVQSMTFDQLTQTLTAKGHQNKEMFGP